MATENSAVMDKLHNASCIVSTVAQASLEEVELNSACTAGTLAVAEGLILEAMELIRKQQA